MKKIFLIIPLLLTGAFIQAQDFIRYYNRITVDGVQTPCEIVVAGNSQAVYFQPLAYGEPTTSYKVVQHVWDTYNSDEHFIVAKDSYKESVTIMANEYNAVFRLSQSEIYLSLDTNTDLVPKGVPEPVEDYECPLDMGTTWQGEFLYAYPERFDVATPGNDPYMSICADDIAQTQSGAWVAIRNYYDGETTIPEVVASIKSGLGAYYLER